MSVSAWSTSENGAPTKFDLRTQKSHDFEGGVRVHLGAARRSVERLRHAPDGRNPFQLRAELRWPTTSTSIRPAATASRRWRPIALSDTFRFKGGFAYTRAVFREGLFAGNDVPLVSRWTGSVGVSWDI